MAHHESVVKSLKANSVTVDTHTQHSVLQIAQHVHSAPTNGLNVAQWMTTTTTIIDHVEVRLNSIHNLSLGFFPVSNNTVMLHSWILKFVSIVQPHRHVNTNFHSCLARVKRYDRHTLITLLSSVENYVWKVDPLLKLNLTDTDCLVYSEGKRRFCTETCQFTKTTDWTYR